MGSDGWQSWRERGTSHKQGVQTVPNMVPTSYTVQVEVTMDRWWLRWHGVHRRRSHDIRRSYSTWNASGGSTDTRSSGNLQHLYFISFCFHIILLHYWYKFFIHFWQGNTLRCSVQEIDRFRSSVSDDRTRSFLRVTFSYLASISLLFTFWAN